MDGTTVRITSTPGHMPSHADHWYRGWSSSLSVLAHERKKNRPRRPAYAAFASIDSNSDCTGLLTVGGIGDSIGETAG